MLISDGINHGKLQSIIVGELKKAGLKHRLKKIILKNVKDHKTVFGAPLVKVPSCSVICCGSTLNIPIVVSEMSSVLRTNAHVEGLFRKAGSQTRQKDIKRLLDAGGCVSEGHHPIDVASVLKLYLRCLPEPLISAEVQDLLLRCRVTAGENGIKPILHTLLLLPVLHVHLLHYIMELLNFIASRHKENLMDSSNLAIVLAPSIMPLPAASTAQRLEHHVALVKESFLHQNTSFLPETATLPTNETANTTLSETTRPISLWLTPHRHCLECEVKKIFIENAQHIGLLTDDLMTQLDDDSDVHQSRRKKRRSGSLNRMLSGLRKMVSGSTNTPATVPENGKTPVMCKSASKRKMEGYEGLSAKIKKEVTKNLPQRELSFTPMKMGITERKRLRLSLMDVRGSPGLKSEFNSNKNSETSVSSEDMLTSSENLFSAHDTIDLSPDMKQTDKDYVRISKQEYEEIKSRVSAIENRLSREFTDVAPRVQPLQNVQNAYEQTLEEVAMLNCPSSEHLARRLSKELKIRPKEQAKIIRSPSARKIGSIRRRSKENIIKIVRHKSWNASTHSQASHESDRFYPYAGMVPRERSSTVKPDSAMKKQNAADDWDISASDNSLNNASNSAQKYKLRKRISLTQDYNLDKTIGRTHTRRSLNITSNNSWDTSENSLNNTKNGDRTKFSRDRPSQQKWRSAAAFFMDKTGELENNGGSGRPSVNKLRQQNAGAVLAKAKLFESSSDKSSESNDKMPNSGFARKPRTNGQSQSKLQRSMATTKPKAPSNFNSSPNIPSRFNRIESNNKNFLRPYPQANQKEEANSWRLNRKTTPPVKKIVSPQSVPLKSPITPAMKKPLSQPRTLRTPAPSNDLKKINTPLKAVHVSPRRRSPRQKLQRSFNQYN